MLTTLHRVAVALALLLPTAAYADSAVDTALIFVTDVSGSMSPPEKQLVREAHAVAVASPRFVEGIAQGEHKRVALAYVEFGTTAAVRIAWQIVDDAESAYGFAELVLGLEDSEDIKGGETAISAGLKVAGGMFGALPWKAERMVIDVAGDGLEDFPGNLGPARAALLGAGVVINGLPFTSSPDVAPQILEAHYEKKVAGGLGHFSMPVTAIEQLPAVLRQKLVQELF